MIFQKLHEKRKYIWIAKLPSVNVIISRVISGRVKAGRITVEERYRVRLWIPSFVFDRKKKTRRKKIILLLWIFVDRCKVVVPLPTIIENTRPCGTRSQRNQNEREQNFFEHLFFFFPPDEGKKPENPKKKKKKRMTSS